MAEAKQAYVKTWLSDAALIVFVVTVTAYAATYLAEFGYCDALKIPWHFISLDGRDVAADVFYFTVGTLGGLVSEKWDIVPLALLVGIIGIYRDATSRISPINWYRRLEIFVFRNFLFARSAVLLAFFALVFKRFGDPNYVPLFGGLLALLLVIGGSLAASWLKLDQGRLYAFEILAYLAFLILGSYAIGYYLASKEKEFLFLDHTNTAVLRVYGDRFVTARLDTKTGCLEERFEEISSLEQKVHLKLLEKAVHPETRCPWP
jgi:hypothetical protein